MALKLRVLDRQNAYGHRWRKARYAFLLENPLCVFCRARGRRAAAKVVDHIMPHRGNRRLFWDRKNWQPLCTTCHNKVKQAQEQELKPKFSCDGIPISLRHHWNNE